MIIYVLVIFVALIIGANNASNAIATLYGSRMMKYSHASLLCAFFVFVGAVAEGGKIAASLNKGFVMGEIPIQAQLGILAITGIMMLVITIFRFPISATQVLVGSLLGGAFALNLDVNSSFTSLAISAWFISMVAGILFAYLIYKLIEKIARKYRNIMFLSKFYFWGTVASSIFAAYALGASIIGMVGGFSDIWFLAPLSAFFGVFLFGKRTSRRIGREMTILDPPRALSAQFAGAIVTEIFIQLHIPVSITQVVTGGVIGTSIVKGRFEISKKVARNLVISWTLAPIVSFGVTYLLLTFF